MIQLLSLQVRCLVKNSYFNIFQFYQKKVYWLQSTLALFLQNLILIMKKTPFNWLQLSTSRVLLRVQLAGQCRDDSLRYYLLAHSLNTKNLYLHVTCVFTMAYIWKPNCRGILMWYNGIFKVFLEGHYRFCSVLAINIQMHQYWCVRRKSRCANFIISIPSRNIQGYSCSFS